MKSCKTPNTRLLPLSILISSLVSGGAIAAQTTQIGDSQQINGVEQHEEKSMFDKVKELLGLGAITSEQADKLNQSITDKQQKLQTQADAQTALEQAQNEAKKAAANTSRLKTEEILNQAFSKMTEQYKTKAEADKNNKDQQKQVAIKDTGLNPADKDIADQITKRVDTTKEDYLANNKELLEKEQLLAQVKQIKKTHDEKIQELTEKCNKVDSDLNKEKNTNKPALEIKSQKAEQAKTTAETDVKTLLGAAKVAHEATESELNDLDIVKKEQAQKNKKTYEDALKPFNKAIDEAKQAVAEIDDNIAKLENKKQSIENDKKAAEHETQDKVNAVTDAEKAKNTAQQQADDAKTAADKAAAAQKAIEAAEEAAAALKKAEQEHQDAIEATNNAKMAHDKADKLKTAAEDVLKAKKDKLGTAQQNVEQLNNTDPTADMPVIDQTISSNDTKTVGANSLAMMTKVAGGTQHVEKDGKIIASIITEGGAVNLAAGSAASGTEVIKGILNNHGGVDIDTVVGAEGKLALSSSDANKPAVSIGAAIGKGGVVMVGQHSFIKKLNSHGEVTASHNAAVYGATINDGTLTLKDTASANNTTLNGGVFTLADKAVAKDSTINDGMFNIADGTTASSTTLNGGIFNIENGATANDTTVKKGTFNLMHLASAHKLIVDDGDVLIAGALKDATFNGGAIIFNHTADVSGKIDVKTDSFIRVHEHATTKDADLTLAGIMELAAADATQPQARSNLTYLLTGSNNPAAQFAFNDVKMAGGTIDMSKANAKLTMASLDGNGTFNLGSTLENYTGAPLNVTGNAKGHFELTISDSGRNPTQLDIVNVGSGDANFSLSNGPVNQGNYQHNLISDGKGGFKLVADKKALTPSTAGVLAVANTAPVIFNAELSSVQNRLDKQSTSANESGVWGTYLNNNFKVKGTAANFDQNLNGMTLGGDKAALLDNGVLSVGGFASYSSSNIKSDYQSSGKVESHSFGAYAQYLANSGYYVNALVKANQFNQDVSITSLSGSATGVSNFSGLGLAMKAGKHINVDALYVSPYIALSSFNAGKSEYKLSNGMDAQNRGSHSVIGSLGVNTGYRFILNNGTEIKPYTLFSLEQDLIANNKILVNNEEFNNSLKGTRANTGVGVNVNLTKNLSIGSEVKFSKGKNIETPMTINAGVGYTF